MALGRDLTDEQLITLCLNGRLDAFRPLVERHGGPLHAYLFGHLGDDERAAEAAQETFVRAVSSLGTLRDPGQFRRWLFGIGRLVFLETLREFRRQPQTLVTDTADPISLSDADLSAHRDRELQDAVRRLPSEQRQVVLMHHYAGQSCREVAVELGVAVGTVTSRLSRAYGQLRTLLRDKADVFEADLNVASRTQQ